MAGVEVEGVDMVAGVVDMVEGVVILAGGVDMVAEVTPMNPFL